MGWWGGVGGKCVSGTSFTFVSTLTVSKMHAMHFNNSSWNMEISGSDVCFRTKHLPKDSGDLNTERKKTA